MLLTRNTKLQLAALLAASPVESLKSWGHSAHHTVFMRALQELFGCEISWQKVSQAGIGHPTVDNNYFTTFAQNITYERVGAGSYIGVMPVGTFPVDRTAVLVIPTTSGTQHFGGDLNVADATGATIVVQSVASDGQAAQDEWTAHIIVAVFPEG